MLTTCLINSFNYQSYVVEAVESALRQTRPFDQIVVVDDGSSDGSQQLLAQRFGREPRVQIVNKENGGQLSCFNHIMPLVTGEIVFFLDADDRYLPTYVAAALACYERTSADFVMAGVENFGQCIRGKQPVRRDRDLGISLLATTFARQSLGQPTSSLSMQTSLAKEILPFPFESEWRIRADDVLNYAASILGAHKYQIGETLVERRVHGTNLYHGNKFDPMSKMRHSLALNQLIAWYMERAGYCVADLHRLSAREFQTLERPTLREYRRYVQIAWGSSQPFFNRMKQFVGLTSHLLRARLERPKTRSDSEPASHSLRRVA